VAAPVQEAAAARVMRGVFAVVCGAMVSVGVVTVSDAFAGRLFSFPLIAPGTDAATTKALLEAAIAKAPLSAMLAMVAGYFVAALCGGFIARKISSGRGVAASLAVGLLVLAATIANFVSMQHPLVMVWLGVLAPLPGALLGARLAK